MYGQTVFVIDDDPTIRESIALLMQTVDLAVRTFDSALGFLEGYADEPGCVISDFRMPVVSGLELQERLVEGGHHIPVIILSGHGDVSAAVRAMKSGAMDFIEKPFDAQLLLERVHHALQEDQSNRRQADEQAIITQRLQRLTRRESEVMQLVVAGKANKVIAGELKISERTVELHRGRIMKKMQARSLADLVRMVT